MIYPHPIQEFNFGTARSSRRPNQGDLQGESFKGDFKREFRGGLLRKLEHLNSNFKGEHKVKYSIKEDLIKNSSLLTPFPLHFTTMIFLTIRCIYDHDVYELLEISQEQRHYQSHNLLISRVS